MREIDFVSIWNEKYVFPYTFVSFYWYRARKPIVILLTLIYRKPKLHRIRAGNKVGLVIIS